MGWREEECDRRLDSSTSISKVAIFGPRAGNGRAITFSTTV